MSSMNRIAAAAIALFFGSASVPAGSQSLGDFLKLIPNGTSADNIVGAIKSLSEITMGQIESGTGPQNADGKVIMYRTQSCPYCKKAASYMRMNNVPFVERDIERNSNYNAEFKRLGGIGVPFIVLGEKTMSGFKEGAFEQNYAEFKRASENANVANNGKPPASNSSSNNLDIRSGDVLMGKINGVVVYAGPSKSEKLAVVGKTDEVIYMGEERQGLYRVTTQKGEGWIDKLLVRRQ